MKIGVIREGKVPHDKRVPFTPVQCKYLLEEYPNLKLAVQPSPYRCYTDAEYLQQGVLLQEDMSDCDVLMGVKEVPKQDLIPGKKYLFFSHTIKKQPQNKGKVCQYGLWNYSRHPNYFFQFSIWLAVFIFVVPSFAVPLPVLRVVRCAADLYSLPSL